MKTIGVIGLGDMGSGLAKNLLASGFDVVGFDLSQARMQAFTDMGGMASDSPADVGAKAEAVFVMVMNGDQAKAVILEDGLLSGMKQGGIILLTATIKPSEARDIAAGLDGSGLEMIDSPVSGGFPGAQGGTLTMMAAGKDEVLAQCRPIMAAVGKDIYKVGEEPGMGQTVKACLQSVMGSVVTATTEAAALAAKAGVDGEVFHQVLSTSSAGCGLANTCLQNIIDRKFEKTGSHIRTMYKDLTISMDMARELGVPIHTAASAMQLFQAGITKYPDGDNWAVTRLTEEIAGAELHRKSGGKS
ncbi:MAG: NAD(P)-dependent oxidoreductase, partial [Geminicoccaceae bacterium]